MMLMLFSVVWAAEMTILETKDEAHIALHHYEAEGPPILLAHGLSSNHRVWDLTEEISLAKHMQQAGLDVWLIDFRGTTILKEQYRKTKEGTFKEQGLYDIDTAIEHILSTSSYERLHFVAYSLSGISFLTYLQAFGGDRIQSSIFIGVPLEISAPDPLMRLAGLTMRFTLFSIPTHKIGRLTSRISALPFAMEELLWNDENIDLQLRHMLLNQIFSPMSPKALHPLAKMIRAESIMDDDELELLLREQHFPFLMIAGRYDKIAPPDRILPLIESLQHDQSTMMIAGKMDGFSTDYGHACLTMSYAASKELYPLMSDWALNMSASK